MMRIPRPVARAALALVLVIVVCLPLLAWAQQVPPAAARYRGELTRQARLVFGFDAPVALLAAQVHQESAWRLDARSSYAHGLAQFTPATADWIGGLDPLLAGAETGNPAWALRALAVYDRWLLDRVPDRGNVCGRWIGTLRAYNGGLGWVQREAKSGQPCPTFRSLASCAENHHYPARILLRHQPLYAGWGPGVRCV